MSHAQGTHNPSEASIPLHDADSIARGDASIGDLVKNASTHASTLLRSEIELAKTEITEQVKKAVTGSVFFVVALVLATLSLLPFVMMWAKLVSLWLGTKTWDWAGHLVVFVVLLLLAGIFAMMGLSKVKKVQKPQRTMDSVQDLKLALPTNTTPAPGTVRTTEAPVASVRATS